MRALTAASCASGCSTRPNASMSVLSVAVRTSATCTPAAVISDGLSSTVVPGCVPGAVVEPATGVGDKAGAVAPADASAKKCVPLTPSRPIASKAVSVPAPTPSAISFVSLAVICFSDLCWICPYLIGQASCSQLREAERRWRVPTPPRLHPWPTMPCNTRSECPTAGFGCR